MRVSQSVAWLLSVSALTWHVSAKVDDPTADLITNLPGLTWQTNYKQYSGYLNAGNGHYLHYWFVESQSKPATDPVVLWLNGGPGCSSLDGLIYENGPFHVTDNGTLYINNYAWNLNTSVIYLEAPIGVGYSYSTDNKYDMNDNTTADDNYHALLDFFTNKFPTLVSNPFYVTGESYGGIYVPTLTLRILQGNADNPPLKINLRAFAVGNGLSSYDLNDDSSVWFAYFHGLVDETLWNNLMASCCTTPYTRQTCNFENSKSVQCQKDVEEVNNVIYGGQLNWYDIYGDCYTTTHQSGFSVDKYLHSLDLMYRKWKSANKNALLLSTVNENVPCIDSNGADIYLNRADVRTAIHIPSTLDRTWSICSSILHYTTLYDTMAGVYQDIFKMSASIYATVYNGDTDLACNFLGDEWFLDDLNLTVKTSYREWYYQDQAGKEVAGWTKDFDRVHFVTVRGAGHMVPQYRPVPALEMFQAFIANRDL